MTWYELYLQNKIFGAFFFVLSFYQKYYKYAFLKLRTYMESRITMNRGKENKVDFKHKVF